jgi:hypothetical protein
VNGAGIEALLPGAYPFKVLDSCSHMSYMEYLPIRISHLS